ncbi:DUF4112 domain-containing protein [Mesorhizobium loti]|uniref:DUF4112 domain-containing protein n=1 Tax=Rhizobium loti TaxID=381 RepID=UPI003D2ECA64
MAYPVSILVRMIANVLIEGVIGSIPVAGDAFDVLWRANRRNMSLLIRHLEGEHRI